VLYQFYSTITQHPADCGVCSVILFFSYFQAINILLSPIKQGLFSLHAEILKDLIPIFAALAKGGEVDEWLKSVVC